MNGKDRTIPFDFAHCSRVLLGFLIPLYFVMSASLPLFCQSEKADQLFDVWQDSIRTYLFTDHQKAIEYVNIYRENAINQEDPFYKAKALNFTGISAYVGGDALLAIEQYLESLALFNSIGDSLHSAIVMNNIGAAYLARRKPMETIGYYEQALAKFRILRDTIWIANVMNNLSIQYVEMKDFDKALQMQKEVLGIFESQKDEASMLLIQGNMADTYRELGDYKAARKLVEDFLNHPLADQDIQQKTNVLSTYAKLEALDNRFSSALKHINEAITLADNLQLRQETANFLYTKSSILESMGKFKEALNSFKRYHLIYDTLYSSEKDQRITELLTQYEVAQKEASIALLEKEKVISKRNQWLMGAGILALSIILVLIISLYRNRQKNIADLKNKNDVIFKMLNEKEYLLKEIHHRVKNNLQIISSLLQLQSRHLEEPNAIEALNDGESRVKSMAIIHQHLYTEGNLGQVNIPKYINDLVSNLKSSYQKIDLEIPIHQDIEDIALDVADMIPIGLIVNELITNIFKYAFHNRQSGNIWINIKSMNDGLHIEVKDDGVGMNLNKVSKGFGTRLIKAFLKKLNATMEVSVNNGTTTSIIVPEFNNYVQRIKTA